MGVTSLRKIAPSLVAAASDPIPGAPPARLTLRPESQDEVAEVLASCSASGLRVLVWGGGNHQDIGHPVTPDVVLSTERINRVVDHQPEDLTLVVEGGATLSGIEEVLRPASQAAIVPEATPNATIGGVVAAGVSGYRRARFGPTRDHLLEVTLATGDGRVVRAGGRVVKNVQGYDLARLAAGSFGSMGVILQVCLKLWPRPAREATVTVADPVAALQVTHRPWAVLETIENTQVYLAGTSAAVESQARLLGGDVTEGHRWPDLPATDSAWSIRVPPAASAEAVDRLPDGTPFIAQHGVGVVDFVAPDPGGLREWAEAAGGSLIRLRGRDSDGPDPWGTPPATLALQRRLVARFDPDRVINPGRLPGGI